MRRYPRFVNPVALLLVVVGYGLAIPVATQLPKVVRTGNRLALTGHQIGVSVAAVGWLIGGRTPLLWLHLLWLLAAAIWFNWRNPRA